MQIIVDADSRRLSLGPTPPVRGETIPGTLTFMKGGVPFRLPAGTAIQIGVKSWNDPSDVLLAYTTATRPEPDGAPYTFSLSLNTSEMLAKFTAGVTRYDCSIEVKWEVSAGSGTFKKTQRHKYSVDADTVRDTDANPSTMLSRNDFLVTNGTGLLVNVAAGYAANGAFVAAQASLAITNATNYIEVTAAGVASVNTTAFTAGSYPLATVVASAGAITANTDLRAWITPKPATGGGVTSITGTANEITVTGTTTPTLSLPSALTFTAKTITGGTFASPSLTTPTIGDGTESAPSLSFTSDANTGVYRPATDTVGIVGGGNDVVRLTGIASATDYIEIKNGIGVGSPLHVLAEGASANIGVHLQPKGSGLFTISDGTDFNKGIRFRSSSSAASAITLLDAVSTAGRVITLPDATGTLALVSGDLGTPSALVGTNITGTASININGTVGATTPSTVAGTTGTFSGSVSTTGNFAEISTSGEDAAISTTGEFANIFTSGNGASISTSGATAHISTSGASAHIQTRSTFKLFGGTYYTTLSHAATADRAIAFPDAAGTLLLADGSGANLTALNASNVSSGTLAAARMANAGVHTGDATGTFPAITLNAAQTGITSVGTLTGGATGAGFTVALNTSTITGTLAADRGGTGVSNTGTITLAGNLVTTGAFNTTFAQAATTTVTLPATSATMARTDAAQTFTGVQTFVNNILTTSANTINIGDSTNFYSRIFTDGTNYRNLLMRFAASVGGPGNCIYAESNVLFKGNFYLTTGGLVSVLQQCVADGVMKLGNDNNTGFTRLNFGGNTSSFSALQTSGTGITAGLANGTAGGSFTASGTLAVTGATTLSAALITTPEALAPALNAGAACGVTTVASGFALNGVNALTLANGTNGQIKTIVCTAVTAAGTATLTPTTCSGFTTVAFTAAGQTLTLQYFTTGGWHLLSVRGATPA